MQLEKAIFQKQFKNDYHKVAVNIVYTHNWLQQYHEATLKPHQITIQQFNVLRILRGQHPQSVSIKTIKERMLDKMSDVSRLVEKLRVKGFLQRTSCVTDRRNVDVAITTKGLALLTKLDKLDDIGSVFFVKLNRADVKKLNQLLDKLRG